MSSADLAGFSDLGFDMEPHHKALAAFARLNLDASSVKPTLRARNLVAVRVPSGEVSIGRTENIDAQKEREHAKGSTAYEVIGEAKDADEAEFLRSEVERYFLRHFPGRTRKYAETDPSSPKMPGSSIYIAFYEPTF